MLDPNDMTDGESERPPKRPLTAGELSRLTEDALAPHSKSIQDALASIAEMGRRQLNDAVTASTRSLTQAIRVPLPPERPEVHLMREMAKAVVAMNARDAKNRWRSTISLIGVIVGALASVTAAVFAALAFIGC